MSIVVTNVARAARPTVESLGAFGVATVHEAQGRRGLMAPHLRPIAAGQRVVGTAVTVWVPPGDNWMLHVAVEQCRPGDMLVVAPTSSCMDGYFGELLAVSLEARGVAALVIDAGVRDVAALRAMGFPVWSRCISAQGTVKETLGSVNVPIACAGQRVLPGDVVLADDDGVVVVDRQSAEVVLRASSERERKEATNRARYSDGELGLDVNDMRPRLAGKGLRYSTGPRGD